jgi:hypothetical protein
VRLLDHLDPDPIALEQTRVIESAGVTHLRYRSCVAEVVAETPLGIDLDEQPRWG